MNVATTLASSRESTSPRRTRGCYNSRGNVNDVLDWIRSIAPRQRRDLLFYGVPERCRRALNRSSPISPVAPSANGAIDEFLALPGIELLPVPVDVVPRLLALIRTNPVTGLRVYDLHLVAAVLGSGVTRIYTFNARDFERFSQLEVLTPSEAPRTTTTPGR